MTALNKLRKLLNLPPKVQNDPYMTIREEVYEMEREYEEHPERYLKYEDIGPGLGYLEEVMYGKKHYFKRSKRK